MRFCVVHVMVGERSMLKAAKLLAGLRVIEDQPHDRLIDQRAGIPRVPVDRKATSISLLVVLGVRQDGQKVLLAVKQMGGESPEAGRTVLDDLVKRGLRRPALPIL